MKYRVDVQLKPKGTFSVLDIIAGNKAKAIALAMENLIDCGYTLSDFKKVNVKEVK
jgi:hypothetical protein